MESSIWSILIKTIREDYNRWGDTNLQMHQLQLMGGTNLPVSSSPTKGMLQHPNSPAPTGLRLQPPMFYQLQLKGCYNTLIFQLQLKRGYNPLVHSVQLAILAPPSHPQQMASTSLSSSIFKFAPNLVKHQISNSHCLCSMSFFSNCTIEPQPSLLLLHQTQSISAQTSNSISTPCTVVLVLTFTKNQTSVTKVSKPVALLQPCLSKPALLYTLTYFVLYSAP